MECLLTLRRIYETERNDNANNPRRPFILSPRHSTPDVSGHQPFKLGGRQSTPSAATPEINYQAVQQVPPPASTLISRQILKPPGVLSRMACCTRNGSITGMRVFNIIRMALLPSFECKGAHGDQEASYQAAQHSERHCLMLEAVCEYKSAIWLRYAALLWRGTRERGRCGQAASAGGGQGGGGD